MSVSVNMNKSVCVEDILIANQKLKEVVVHTPLQKSQRLSEQYDCHVYLKREDLQHVRSFKLRGAYHKMDSLSKEERENGIVCASAGNHAQGVAYACSHMQIKGKIYMPATTPRQKINQVKMFGKGMVEVHLVGDTFDDSFSEAMECCHREQRTFIHPFDDELVIAGQGTIAVEILNNCEENVDYIFASIGGGGLMAGISTYCKSISPSTKCIGVEPSGAPSMKESIKQEKVTPLQKIDGFVDGAAVKCVGKQTFELCRDQLEDIVVVPEGKVCTTILQLYNEHAIVAEPAGALSIAALDFYREEIKGKNVVCIISGGNNDIDRMQEIKERSLLYEGLLHYFIINFPQRAGALREFLDKILGPTDDVTRFEYTKNNNKESGPALIGVELKKPGDYVGLMDRMKQNGVDYVEVNKDPNLFNLLI
ncbi:MAG: threonine ammonia-lyase IlvA [Bacillus sp. (in: firmicutes)]